MFWRRGADAPEEGTDEGTETRQEPQGDIRIEPDAPRPATILRVAGELEDRGGKIVELFKEVDSPLGKVVMPIHLRQDDQDVFMQVRTAPWDEKAVAEAATEAAIVRGSEHSEKELEFLSAYPLPREVSFVAGDSPAALLQLDLLAVDTRLPESAADLFREVAGRHWGVELRYENGYLPLVEELLMAALDEDREDEGPPIFDALVEGLGCFLGETIRREAGPPACWRPAEEWSEGPVVEAAGFALDPVGKARAFVSVGREDSVAFYAGYVIGQVEDTAGSP